MSLGMKVRRESVYCPQCGSSFERAVVHPYIVKCPSCRGSAPAATPVTPVTAVSCPAEREARVARAARALHEAASGPDDAWVAARDELSAAMRERY